MGKFKVMMGDDLCYSIVDDMNEGTEDILKCRNDQQKVVDKCKDELEEAKADLEEINQWTVVEVKDV